ncbi:ABC transporter substrate-binding protein [Variovorax boronicumulans]|uniref:ABC transporter substrate-binding protein n=1 Tax=Variovorax boronicumulans TaxID=436515 RepID=UPI001C55E091
MNTEKKKTDRLQRRTVLKTVAAGAVVGPMFAFAQPAPIKIGSVLSLTGPGAGLGQPERAGILLAERVINEKGGVRGRPIKILLDDDGSNPNLAKSKAEHLIFGEKVCAFIGPSLTAGTGAVAAITNREKMAQVTFTGLGPAIELSYKSLYHVLPPQALNARAMLEYASRGAKAKRIGVLHDTGYGQAVLTGLREHMGAYGVEFVSIERFEVGATDVSAQAAKVRAAEPDLVFVIATSPVPFRNARQMRITQQIVSAVGSASYDYVRGMGEFADDIVFPEFLVGEDPLPRQSEFVELYRKANNTLPKNFEAAGWDAVHLIVRALEKVGPDVGNEAIAQALREPYEGVLAKYNFGAADMTGIDLSSFVYSRLVKGKFTRLPFTAGA